MAAGRVLIIEDNVVNMELALALLEKANCDTLEAINAEEGIALAKSELPDLILMDVSLPGMDGLTATQVLKQYPTTKGIPVIVLTAHAMRGDEAKAVAAGCDGYLTKPIDMREFLRTIAQFITPDTKPAGDEGIL